MKKTVVAAVMAVITQLLIVQSGSATPAKPTKSSNVTPACVATNNTGWVEATNEVAFTNRVEGTNESLSTGEGTNEVHSTNNHGDYYNGTGSGNAPGFYNASLQAVSISTNQSGNLVYRNFGNQNLIQAGATAQGITNLAGLKLVYDQVADALEVVSGTNDTLVSTPLTFATGVFLSNTNGTQIQRFAGVYWGTNLTADGSLVAGEEIVPATTTQPAKFGLQGQLQFVVPASGTNAPVIYVGNVSVGNHNGH